MIDLWMRYPCSVSSRHGCVDTYNQFAVLVFVWGFLINVYFYFVFFCFICSVGVFFFGFFFNFLFSKLLKYLSYKMHWKFMQQKQPHSSSDFVHVSMAEKSQNSAWQIYDTLTRIWTEYDNLSCMAFWFHDQQ